MAIAIDWITLCESSACPEVAWTSSCESGACPEAGFTEEGVYIRDSARPDEIIYLDRKGWDLLQTIKAPWEQ